MIVQGQVAMDHSNPEAAVQTPSNSAEETAANIGSAQKTDSDQTGLNETCTDQTGTGNQH